ncbi:MAG: phosphoglucomutase/phosphomannomutase family protein [Dehalococcoidia bacterium]|nr:phosphoglucomutase/phosphomannomutase family protein [Dehalococcoidia bacterium]
MTDIKFGTDGWRALIAEEFTFDNVRIVSQAFADYLRKTNQTSQGVVVGFDTRFAGSAFAAAVAEVLAANDIHVGLTASYLPTPALSYSVLNRSASAGVMITASHNPARYNGFKVKMSNGASAPEDVTRAIEDAVPNVIARNAVKQLPLGEAESRGLVETFDIRPAYIATLRDLVDIEAIRAAGYNVLVDSMYGAAGGLTADILGEGATRVVEIHAMQNPAFPGMRAPEPIAANLGEQLSMLASGGYAVGLSTDGDGDRFGLADERGTFITQLQVYALLTRYLLEVRGERGHIVKSITTSRMMDRLGAMFDCPVIETRVGFKYLGEKMEETNALIAGEESGGYAFRGHIPERDGILSGLYFLDYMVRAGKTPSQLLADLFATVGRHEYDRVDITLRADERDTIQARAAAADPKEIAGIPVVGRDQIDGFRFHLEGGWWLLLRFSGTEPLLRVYAEMPSSEQVQDALQAGMELVGVAL